MQRQAREHALAQRRAAFYSKVIHQPVLDVNRFRKRKPLDCGRAKCRVCHCDKLFGYPRPADIRADDAMKAQLQECGD